MPEKNKPAITHDDDLRAENEVKKLKLEMEFGAQFGLNSTALPPEVEKQFLDNVLAFEKQYAERVQIKLFDYIGRPDCIPAAQLTDKQLVEESLKLCNLLEENGINVSVLAEYPDEVRLLYTFVTEELFDHEIDNMRMPGWTLNFIYEEFYPNHPYDIRNRCNEFIDYIFRDTFPGEERFDKCVISCSDLIYDESDESEYKRMLSPTLSNYFDAFPTRDLDEFEITSLENDDEFGLVKFTIKYNVFTETKENLTFSGNGQFVLIQEYGWWMIKKVDMPGLELH